MTTRHKVLKHLDSALHALHDFLDKPRLCDAELCGIEPELRELQRRFEVATAFGRDAYASKLDQAIEDIRALEEQDRKDPPPWKR